MKEIINICDTLQFSEDGSRDKLPVKDLGFISLTNSVHIRHVSFFDPCIILVLSGRKVIFHSSGPITCEAGATITVPAPSSFDMRNETDSRSNKYRALVIPFNLDLLERLIQTYRIDQSRPDNEVAVLTFDEDETLFSSIKHYLASAGNPRLIAHRLMEILLILIGKNPKLASYVLNKEKWSPRVRAILADDLAHCWTIREVCKRLSTTESTLRRNLKKEQKEFRRLLYDLRLSSALMQIMQTSLPIYQIAYDCGYRSVSRFSSNFHKRFGLPPRQLRNANEPKKLKILKMNAATAWNNQSVHS